MLHKQSPTLNFKCRINKGLIKKESTIDYRRSRRKGRIIMAHRSYSYSFIQSSRLPFVVRSSKKYPVSVANEELCNCNLSKISSLAATGFTLRSLQRKMLGDYTIARLWDVMPVVWHCLATRAKCSSRVPRVLQKKKMQYNPHTNYFIAYTLRSMVYSNNHNKYLNKLINLSLP
jgi:hypothetical protein